MQHTRQTQMPHSSSLFRLATPGLDIASGEFEVHQEAMSSISSNIKPTRKALSQTATL